MKDDYSAPLGLDRPGPPRRGMPIWPFLFGPSVLLVVALGLWAVLSPDPGGGRPSVVVDLPPAPPPVAPVDATPPPAEQPPDDPDGQIIIRDP
ncbi:hypothetical protein OSH08_01395 [Kaistia geumhonensis]|uniref:Uncharacterized protein n=1 Tax=Kaistia geumhonensis TaxID=410839 RepID=A0ABU0M8S0_9HYPH|nr:hypothetical protein [Kaistia geumhonensis]MCX5477639.1 hypothetical protein [Kaistia geumhonensis]MDQ0517153.1 hypothetical protein [Kaistia geumhonensis]